MSIYQDWFEKVPIFGDMKTNDEIVNKNELEKYTYFKLIINRKKFIIKNDVKELEYTDYDNGFTLEVKDRWN